MSTKVRNKLLANTDEAVSDGELLKYFSANPQPTDEQIHQLAADHGLTPAQLEDQIYRLFGKALSEIRQQEASITVTAAVELAAEDTVPTRTVLMKAGGVTELRKLPANKALTLIRKAANELSKERKTAGKTYKIDKESLTQWITDNCADGKSKAPAKEDKKPAAKKGDDKPSAKPADKSPKEPAEKDTSEDFADGANHKNRVTIDKDGNLSVGNSKLVEKGKGFVLNWKDGDDEENINIKSVADVTKVGKGLEKDWAEWVKQYKAGDISAKDLKKVKESYEEYVALLGKAKLAFGGVSKRDLGNEAPARKVDKKPKVVPDVTTTGRESLADRRAASAKSAGEINKSIDTLKKQLPPVSQRSTALTGLVEQLVDDMNAKSPDHAAIKKQLQAIQDQLKADSKPASLPRRPTNKMPDKGLSGRPGTKAPAKQDDPAAATNTLRKMSRDNDPDAAEVGKLARELTGEHDFSEQQADFDKAVKDLVRARDAKDTKGLYSAGADARHAFEAVVDKVARNAKDQDIEDMLYSFSNNAKKMGEFFAGLKSKATPAKPAKQATPVEDHAKQVKLANAGIQDLNNRLQGVERTPELKEQLTSLGKLLRSKIASNVTKALAIIENLKKAHPAKPAEQPPRGASHEDDDEGPAPGTGGKGGPSNPEAAVKRIDEELSDLQKKKEAATGRARILISEQIEELKAKRARLSGQDGDKPAAKPASKVNKQPSGTGTSGAKPSKVNRVKNQEPEAKGK